MSQALDTFGGKTVAAAKLARAMVARLNDDSDPEDWALAESQVREVKAFAAELSVAFNDAFADRLKRLGDIELGDRRFYAGVKKRDVRLREPGDIFEMLMQASFGDLDRIKQCLASNWYKKSELAEVLDPEVFDSCIAVETVDDPKTGKPKREPRLTR